MGHWRKDGKGKTTDRELPLVDTAIVQVPVEEGTEARAILGDKNATFFSMVHSVPGSCTPVSVLHNIPELCSTLYFLIKKQRLPDLSTNLELVRAETVY